MSKSRFTLKELPPIRLYRELEANEQFVVFADPADSHDYCAAVAFSKKHYDCPLIFNMVMESSQFGYDLFYLCKFIYNRTNVWPKLAVERNTGQATIFVLKQLNYPDLFRMVDFSSTTTHEGGQIGWVTSGALTGTGELTGTRRKMLDDLALAIKQKMITLYDEEQIRQMMAFMIVKGRAQAKRNQHDDLTMATAGVWQVAQLTPALDFASWDADAMAEQRKKWRFT